MADRIRPQWAPAYIWCDYHGEIHKPEPDYYGEQVEGCVPDNWRKVYIMGTKGEFLL